jgi:hypothetical protein
MRRRLMGMSRGDEDAMGWYEKDWEVSRESSLIVIFISFFFCFLHSYFLLI